MHSSEGCDAYALGVCTENLIRVEDVMESPKLRDPAPGRGYRAGLQELPLLRASLLGMHAIRAIDSVKEDADRRGHGGFRFRGRRRRPQSEDDP
jgi:hypothetical protein